MTDMRGRSTTGDPVAPERVVCADSHARMLLAVAARAVHGRDCGDLGYLPLLSRFRGLPLATRRTSIARAGARMAVPPRRVGDIDADAVAAWVVGHYPASSYPAVVVGSPHGAAVHLAAALGAAWLPCGFPMVVQWPDGTVDDPTAALLHGARMAPRLLARNPGLVVRQVHDPAARGVLAGSTIAWYARWRHLPPAYRTFLSTRLRPGAPVLVLRDARTWPVLDLGGGHSFQVGDPVSGLEPGDYRAGGAFLGQILRALGGDPGTWRPPGLSGPEGYAAHGVEPAFEESLRGWGRDAGSPVHRVLFPGPETLSAAVADVVRQWMRDSGKSGNRCVVEAGRLLDPMQAVRAGLVPYWVESAARRTVSAAEWWLAGSDRFSSLDVLPEAPGMACTALAGLPQWRAVASFGRLRGQVDRTAARSYPLHPLPTRHATEMLRGQPYDLPRPTPLRVTAALAGLRDSGTASGLLVC